MKDFSQPARKAWTPPVLEQLTVDLDAIAARSNTSGDSKNSNQTPS